MAGRWMCAGGKGEPVRIVHGDGQVLSPMPPVRVADILHGYPHHYICHMSPELPSNKSAMLPLDSELEPGYVYFLLPLPRLFPTSASGPPSCCCRLSNHDRSLEEGHMTPRSQMRAGFAAISVRSVKHFVDRIGSPMRASGKKVSPELSRSPYSSGNSSARNGSPFLSPTYGSSKSGKRSRLFGGFSPGKRGNSSPSRGRGVVTSGGRVRGDGDSGGRCPIFDNMCNRWKPGLGCISENEMFVTACEELRLCLDRRRLTFDAKVRPNSPSMRLSDALRTAPIRFAEKHGIEVDEEEEEEEEDEYEYEREEEDDKEPSKSSQRVPLANFIFV